MHEQEEAKEMLERIMKQNKEKYKQARAEMMKEAKVRGQGQGSKPR